MVKPAINLINQQCLHLINSEASLSWIPPIPTSAHEDKCIAVHPEEPQQAEQAVGEPLLGGTQAQHSTGGRNREISDWHLNLHHLDPRSQNYRILQDERNKNLEDQGGKQTPGCYATDCSGGSPRGRDCRPVCQVQTRLTRDCRPGMSVSMIRNEK